jgi:hypothetical protein
VPPHSDDGLARDRLAVEHDAPGSAAIERKR